MSHPAARAFVSVLLVAGCDVSTPASTSPRVAPTGTPGVSAVSAAPTVAPSAGTPEVLLEPGGRLVDAPPFADLIPTPAGFMALAWHGDGPMVRGSADGSTWTLLDTEAAFGPPVEDVVAAPSGWIVSQRVPAATVLSVGAVLWFSADGRAWEPLPDQAGLGAAFAGPVAAGPWGYAMSGQVVDASGTSVFAVWASRDGRRWQLVEPTREFGNGRVVVTSTGVVAVDPDQGRLVITTDGSAWSEPAEDTRLEGALVGVGPDAESLVVVTADASGLTAHTVAVEAAAPPVLEWHAVDADGLEGAGATALATGERGTLLLGFDLDTLAPRTWDTVDGRTWHRTDLAPPTFGGGVPTLAAVGSDAFVVLGWQSSDAGLVRAQAWISPDGRSWEPVEADAFGELPTSPGRACPASTPTDVPGFVGLTVPEDPMSAAVWPACFGNRTLEIDGWIQGCGGCGGVPSHTGSPSWLIDPEGYSAFWLSSAAEPEGPGGGIGIQIDPQRPVALPEAGTHARVSGHFNDAASDTCRLIPIPGWFVDVPPAALVAARCRQHFVAEEIELLPS